MEIRFQRASVSAGIIRACLLFTTGMRSPPTGGSRAPRPDSELPAAPAVPSPRSRRRNRHGHSNRGRHGAPRRVPRGVLDCHLPASGGDRAGRKRAQLGTTGGAEPSGRALRGAGAARTGPASSRRLAPAALAALAGPRRHRQRGDCADRDRVRDRTKTRTFNDQHVARVEAIASWLRARRRRWCPEGALAVLCVVHARRLERVDAGVLIVSLDRLVGALRTAAGTRQRPRFLAGPASPQPKQGWESNWNET